MNVKYCPTMAENISRTQTFAAKQVPIKFETRSNFESARECWVFWKREEIIIIFNLLHRFTSKRCLFCPVLSTYWAICCLPKHSEAPYLSFNAPYILKLKLYIWILQSQFKSEHGCSFFSNSNNHSNTGHKLVLKHGQLSNEIIKLNFTQISTSSINIHAV